MSDLILRRIDQTAEATFGHLTDSENKQLCVTLELPWKDNAHGVSCIPPGIYPLRRRFSPKHRCEVFEVENVPDRQNIELHIGNFASDTEGCVLLGTAFGTFEHEHGITGSRAAFESFMRAMQGIDAATITILDPLPIAA